jgi:hypothetical protein
MLKMKMVAGLIITISVLSGCAAGMAGVHRGNADVYTTLLVELGPKSEDTADEKRRRPIYMVKLIESIKALEKVSPNEGKIKRDYVEKLFNTKI